jgi:uncharacterized protein YbjT (DUF2867 family)/uncharacterized membrane protein YphA (DoxX/SURF4 family)
MRVLVTGAYGFIGADVVAALIAAGHEVVCAVRAARVDARFPGVVAIACDMATDVDEAAWLPRLVGVDAVVNCAGILRERGTSTFESVHVAAPLALFRACATAGVRRVIQMSALGDPADGEFVASKHRCDHALSMLALDWVVLRPSVVYSTRGAYGGTSLLRALAALSYGIALPGDGRQRLQPVALPDLAQAVVAILAAPNVSRGTFELVGPNVVTLADYLRAWRRWLGIRGGREWHVPLRCVRAISRIGEAIGRGPLGLTMLRMLERGNIGNPGAWERVRERLGVAAASLECALSQTPAQTQDRQHARAYFWIPALRGALAALWIASGLLGLALPTEVVGATTPAEPIEGPVVLALARIGGGVDLVLGLLCFARWRPRLVLAAMTGVLAIYTVAIGTLWPQHWLDPFGGLIKNIPLLAALGLLLAVEERR